MNCDQFREHMADYLGSSLDEYGAAEFHAHRADCAACRQESEELSSTWERLGLLPAPEPGPALRARFYQSLEGYQRALTEEPEPGKPGGLREAFRLWWSRQPVFQVAFSMALLLVGLAIGRSLAVRPAPGGAEVHQLQAELQNMRQVVGLALLQQQSASDRLRGVDYSSRIDQPDTQVLAALMYTVDYDSNVNVRLAAVDGLRKFASSPLVRRGLDDSLARQDSPLVQIALIDLITDARNSEGAPALRSLVANAAANEQVKARAAAALSKLQMRKD